MGRSEGEIWVELGPIDSVSDVTMVLKVVGVGRALDGDPVKVVKVLIDALFRLLDVSKEECLCPFRNQTLFQWADLFVSSGY